MYDQAHSVTGGSAITQDCVSMMFLYLNHNSSKYLLASEIYNHEMKTFVSGYLTCHLYVAGGTGASRDEIAPDDQFMIGNYDFIQAISDSIVSFAGNGSSEYISVCGSLPSCYFTSMSKLSAFPTIHGLPICFKAPD